MNNFVFFGNDLLTWGTASLITLGTMLMLILVKRITVRKITAFAKKTESHIDDVLAEVIAGTRLFFIFIGSAYIGAQFLTLSPAGLRVVDHGMIIALIIQIAIWANRAIAIGLRQRLEKTMEEDAAGSTTLAIIGLVIRVALWAVTLLLILDNLGINITALVTGLGIGGIAVALAVQNILGDIFASLSIALDKPFVIGDFIIVGDKLGTVEYIGLKTTRLRSLSGEQVVFSNAQLLNSVIHNYKRMYERRVVFSFGVIYQTSAEQLKNIPSIVRKIIESQDKVRFDRAHFKSYGESSLDFEVVYFVKDSDYNVYMDIHQAINLSLYDSFAQEKIEFAYPTRTLYVTQVPTPSPSNLESVSA